MVARNKGIGVKHVNLVKRFGNEGSYRQYSLSGAYSEACKVDVLRIKLRHTLNIFLLTLDTDGRNQSQCERHMMAFTVVVLN